MALSGSVAETSELALFKKVRPRSRNEPISGFQSTLNEIPDMTPNAGKTTKHSLAKMKVESPNQQPSDAS